MTVLVGITSSGTTGDFATGGTTVAWDHVASATGSLVKISCQTKVANAGSATWRLGIYADSAGSPGALLGVGNVDTGTPTGTGLFSAPISPAVAITNGVTYWLAMYATDSDSQLNFQGSTSGNYYETATARNFADPYGTKAGPSTIDILIYGEDSGAAAEVIPFLVMAPPIPA